MTNAFKLPTTMKISIYITLATFGAKKNCQSLNEKSQNLELEILLSDFGDFSNKHPLFKVDFHGITI